ncbi:MAG: RNA polymerase sigma factor [Planctomycetota bacterium]|nr:RNA polymerase sigma factor [Planctomycetota bacterium]
MDRETLEQQLRELHSDSWGWALCCSDGQFGLAEDALQIAYSKALAKAQSFRNDSSVRTWLFGIIRFTVKEQQRDLQRWNKHHPSLPSTDPIVHSSATSNLENRELRETLQRHLRTLSPRQQETLHLVFYQDLTLEEAALIMQVSLGSARTHYHRGKEALRTRLQSKKESHHDRQ